jgi:hypothetical protein
LPRSWQSYLLWDRLSRDGRVFSYWARCADYWECVRGQKIRSQLLIEHNRIINNLDTSLNRLEFELEKLEKR